MASPRNLVYKRLLTEDRDARLVVALAEDGEQQPAVVILSKPPFQESHVQEIVSGNFASTEEHRNDKFSKHSLDVPARLNGIMATMICPANEVDVAKYTHQTKHFVRETAALYTAVTEPFVRALPPKQLAWVWNILDHEKEVESIIDETEHYVMVPDTKWDQSDAKQLHCLCIAKDRGLHSLRDLRGSHLPMLRHTLAAGRAALLRAHGVLASQLRVYVHYLPSFWQLHVHFALISCGGAVAGTSVGKAVLLEDVIDNLARDGEYYATCSLSYAVGENEPLFGRLREHLQLEPAAPAEGADGQGEPPAKQARRE